VHTWCKSFKPFNRGERFSDMQGLRMSGKIAGESSLQESSVGGHSLTT
jgi:hypothetical protein